MSIFKLLRSAIWYALTGVALVRVARAFSMRPDVLALCQFAVTVSIIIVLFLLLLKKKAVLSLIPDLPYPSFKSFINLLRSYYFPLIVFSFAMALLWSIGFRHLGR